jgi:hypothetical protein
MNPPVHQFSAPTLLIDDFRGDDRVSALGTSWRGVSDRVMGGISQETLRLEMHRGRRCLRLCGDVRLENNGGFIQMALDLDPGGGCMDASSFTGLRLMVFGNRESYSVHLRTADVVRPWQSYRAHFDASPEWREVRLPFSDFRPHRLETPMDLTRLRRIGIVAIGRAFFADLRLGEIAFFE